MTILSQGMEAGTVRNLAITGSPTIPQKLNLSAAPDLAGWLPDEYLESSNGDNADWDKLGEEITCRLRQDAPGSKQESLLVYHRPILEDGRIEYEFYSDPGKMMVHPALGRMAFLLEPDGVKIHLLTDGVYERTGLSPDNTADEPESRRGPASIPLKPKAWNRLAISLEGDRVALALNDQPIYDRAIDPVNQRTFGLFHFADFDFGARAERHLRGPLAAIVTLEPAPRFALREPGASRTSLDKVPPFLRALEKRELMPTASNRSSGLSKP